MGAAVAIPAQGGEVGERVSAALRARDQVVDFQRALSAADAALATAEAVALEGSQSEALPRARAALGPGRRRSSSRPSSADRIAGQGRVGASPPLLAPPVLDPAGAAEALAGTLTVEDRNQTTESRSIDDRIGKELRSVRRGESRALTTPASISPEDRSTALFDGLRAASVGLRSGIRALTTERDPVT